METEADVIILGAGLAGLSAAIPLGKRAIVLERDSRPGSLARTEHFGGYWFDRVIHLLYFADRGTEERIINLPGIHLDPCPPMAWVECSAGTVRFPFQLHLHGLNPKIAANCLRDCVRMWMDPPRQAPRNFQEILLQTFGRSM